MQCCKCCAGTSCCGPGAARSCRQTYLSEMGCTVLRRRLAVAKPLVSPNIRRSQTGLVLTLIRLIPDTSSCAGNILCIAAFMPLFEIRFQFYLDQDRQFQADSTGKAVYSCRVTMLIRRRENAAPDHAFCRFATCNTAAGRPGETGGVLPESSCLAFLLPPWRRYRIEESALARWNTKIENSFQLLCT